MDKLFEYLGYKPEEGKEADVDAFKSFFQTQFVSRDTAKTDPDIIRGIEGKRIGSINTAVNRLFGETIGMTAEDLKNAKLEDVLGTVKEKYDDQLAEMKKKSGEGNDKKVNDLLAQLEDKDKSITAYKSNIEKLETEFNGFKESKEGEINKYMTDHQLNEVYSQVPFVDGMTDIQKVGFRAIVGQSVKLGLDENKKLIVRDAEGNPIPSAKTAKEFATPIEVLSQLAEKNGLLKKNNAKANETLKTVVTNGQPTERKLSPRYQQLIAEKIK